MNLGHFTSFPSIFILHSSLCSAFFLSVSLFILLPYLRHMAELWTVEQGARPAQNSVEQFPLKHFTIFNPVHSETFS